MSNPIRWRDEHHLLPLVLATSFVLVMAIAIAVAVVWSRDTNMDDQEHISSRAAMQHAYNRVVPGKTTQAELTAFGLDSSHYKTRILSGLGVQEYFMPRTSSDFDRLDPAVRACFENMDRCRALVFPLDTSISGGFMSANAAQHETGRMVFLLRNGRVAYKAMDGV